MQCVNTIAKPATKAPHGGEQYHVIKIHACASEGKQNADSCASNYNTNSEALQRHWCQEINELQEFEDIARLIVR